MKTPLYQAKVVSILDARVRLREHPQTRPRHPRVAPPNVWTCKDCDEVTEELLQFHPVFRYTAE